MKPRLPSSSKVPGFGIPGFSLIKDYPADKLIPVSKGHRLTYPGPISTREDASSPMQWPQGEPRMLRGHSQGPRVPPSGILARVPPSGILED